ncbi:MAG: agmatine deiminase family protein [Pseudomonadota bacterium]
MSTDLHDPLRDALAAGKTPGELGFFMPAETAPHAACWMAWPHDDHPESWGRTLPDVQATMVNVARAISAFEPVRVVVHPEEVPVARAALPAHVDIVALDQDDLWFRDTGPLFLGNGAGGRIAGRMRFNSWGGKFPIEGDATVAGALIDHLNLPRFDSPLTGEGGGLHTDGAGTVITTETFLLNPNRNPGLSRKDAEEQLFHLMGARKVIWLPGDEDEWITDGHIDGILTFVAPGKVIFETNPDPENPRHAVTHDNLRALQGQTDAAGRDIEIIEISEAYDVEPLSDVMATSYVNSYIANGGIVMPEFGVATDKAAQDVFARAFPDRKIATVDLMKIAPGGGGIHCITQQQPL